MIRSTARRLLLVALAGAAPAAGLAVAAPAAAVPLTDCSALVQALEYTGSHVVGEKYRICDDGTIRELSVTVQRQNPSTGAWSTVATGTGTAAHRCQGTAVRRYRVGTTGPGTAYACT